MHGWRHCMCAAFPHYEKVSRSAHMFNPSLQFLVYGWRHFLCAAFLLGSM